MKFYYTIDIRKSFFKKKGFFTLFFFSVALEIENGTLLRH